MTPLVVDTNVVSYLMKGHHLAALYRPHLVGHSLAISFMTVAEMFEGARRANWGERKLADLERVLRGYVVIPSRPDVCRHYADIRYERRAHPIAVDDAWIAASARALACPLVTHNPEDFRDILDLRIITEAAGEHL